jgi:hypothetical protein
VQALLSLLHADPAGLRQESVASVHVVLHSVVHGLPACPLQVPPPQVSAPLQNRPSSHGLELSW